MRVTSTSTRDDAALTYSKLIAQVDMYKRVTTSCSFLLGVVMLHPKQLGIALPICEVLLRQIP